MAKPIWLVLLLGTVCIPPSYAGIQRFWATQTASSDSIFAECENLEPAQQQQFLNAYQALHDDVQKADLKNRILWFCGLSAQEQQRMRTAWQGMSNKERNQVKKKLQATDNSQERNQIRHDIVEKYTKEINQ